MPAPLATQRFSFLSLKSSKAPFPYLALFSLLFLSTQAYCPYGNEPVCGSDNRTYINLCDLNKGNAVLKHTGQCAFRFSTTNPNQLVANCTADFDPVCGVDGVTYGNHCRLRFRAIDLAYRGPCGVEDYDPVIFKDKSCTCSYEWHPVCTRNSFINFENLCFIRCIHQLEGSYDSCSAPCKCPVEYNPVCSLTGTTFDNDCQLKCANATKQLNGECESLLFDCDTGCSRTFAPVCGEDQKAYRNQCMANCRGVKILHQGLCYHQSKDPEKVKLAEKRGPSDKSIEALCARCSRSIRHHPVCSEEGVTYESECHCQCQNKGVCPKYSDGPCPAFHEFQSPCNRCFSSKRDPVCGNDFKTYENTCYLQCNGVAYRSKGKCNSFAPPMQTSYDARTPNWRGVAKGGDLNFQIERVKKLSANVMAKVNSGQHVDPQMVRSLLDIMQVLARMQKSQ